MKLVDEVDRAAEELGAANTLVRRGGKVVAYNTDPVGLADDLRALGAVGRTAVVIGSGGGALAAVAAAHAIGAKVVAVTSRSWASTEELGHLRKGRGVPQPAGADLHLANARRSGERLEAERGLAPAVGGGGRRTRRSIIQATTAGMKGADPRRRRSLHRSLGADRAGALAYDLVYNPKQTPFLRAARKRGFGLCRRSGDAGPTRGQRPLPLAQGHPQHRGDAVGGRQGAARERPMSIATLRELEKSAEAPVWSGVSVAGDLERARTEWLHTNGAGAFATSTVAQMNTRRYHGLLVAALDPPRKRHVVVSHMDATLEIGDERFELVTHQFPHVHPTPGYRYLKRFDQDPLPRWTFGVAGGQLEQTIALVRGQNALVLRYVWQGEASPLLTVRPLLGASPVSRAGARARLDDSERGASRQRSPGSPRSHASRRWSSVTTRPSSDRPTGGAASSTSWSRRAGSISRRISGPRGLLDAPRSRCTASISSPRSTCCPGSPPAELLEEARSAVAAADPGPSVAQRRRAGCRSRPRCFARTSRAQPGIIAGYPWFEVWGRDSLVSLPGLYLVQNDLAGGRGDPALDHRRNGRRAGPQPPAGRGEAHRVPFGGHHAVALRSGSSLCRALAADDAFVRTSSSPRSSRPSRRRSPGTRHNIHVTADGLFAAADPGFALTWMDAKVGDWVVTPRAGLAGGAAGALGARVRHAGRAGVVVRAEGPRRPRHRRPCARGVRFPRVASGARPPAIRTT